MPFCSVSDKLQSDDENWSEAVSSFSVTLIAPVQGSGGSQRAEDRGLILGEGVLGSV